MPHNAIVDVDGAGDEPIQRKERFGRSLKTFFFQLALRLDKKYGQIVELKLDASYSKFE